MTQKTNKQFQFAEEKPRRLLGLLIFLLVLLLHILAGFILFASKAPSISVGEAGSVDMTEGASSGAPIEYFDVKDIADSTQQEEKISPKPPEQEPSPEPKVEKTVEDNMATKAAPEEKADVEEKPSEKKQPPKPDSKPEPKPKPEPEQKKRKHKDVKPKSSIKTAGKADKKGSLKAGNGGTSPKAAGKQGEGVNAFTSASHLGSYLHNPKPPYPALSIENGEEGTVTLRVVVEPDGSPSSVEIAKSSGYRRLDQSALRTVKSRYKFIPAKRFGVPVQATYTFSIKFSINNQ